MLSLLPKGCRQVMAKISYRRKRKRLFIYYGVALLIVLIMIAWLLSGA
jgi:predicted nucleic acid-binding Zn ribbon protein